GSGPAGYSSAPVMYYYSSPVAVSAFGDGSGSTGGFSRSMSVASYRDSFGSDGGGYSAVRTRSVQGTGLLGRVRARTGGLAPIRRSVSSGMNCVDGACYPN
ncbi:MAG: hypothetical protein JNK57_22805, partial [Planctomycetaceae bacterium]|nr:hypothetical protein [Planctomycetaceae bacterium]